MSESQSPEEVVEDIEQTKDRLAEAVEALAYKKGHVKDDVKGAVAEKKEQVKDKLGEKKDEVVGAVKEKVGEKKDEILSKVADAKEAVASKLPGGGGGDPSLPSDKEGLASKVADAKDAVISKLGDLKDAVAEKLPGGSGDAGGKSEDPAAGHERDHAQDLPPGVEVIAVDEQGRPRSDDEPSTSTARALRGLAGELRSGGQGDAAELADDQATRIAHGGIEEGRAP